MYILHMRGTGMISFLSVKLYCNVDLSRQLLKKISRARRRPKRQMEPEIALTYDLSCQGLTYLIPMHKSVQKCVLINGNTAN